MPIDDERRRFRRTKATPDNNPQSAVATEGELGSKGGVQESLQELQETLLLQHGERAEFRLEEEKRIEANKQAAQRARAERNEKHERLKRAFEKMDRWKDEENAEAAEELRRVQGMRSSSYLGKSFVQCN